MIRAAARLCLLMLAIPAAAEPATGETLPVSPATEAAAATTPTPKPAPVVTVSAARDAPTETPPPVRSSNGSIIIDASLTPVQRAEQDLLANAGAMSRANLELQTRNQALQLQNENLSLQVKLLQQDQSADGIRNGALAAIAGVLLGWFLAGAAMRRARKHSW